MTLHCWREYKPSYSALLPCGNTQHSPDYQGGDSSHHLAHSWKTWCSRYLASATVGTPQEGCGSCHKESGQHGFANIGQKLFLINLLLSLVIPSDTVYIPVKVNFMLGFVVESPTEPSKYMCWPTLYPQILGGSFDDGVVVSTWRKYEKNMSFLRTLT